MRAAIALGIALATSTCGKSADSSGSCARVWTARAGALDAVSKELDAAEAGIADREVAAKQRGDEVEKKLAALTVAYQDRESYPDRIKGVIAKQKMRLGNMSPMKRELGKPAVAIRYDLEIQGEYKNVAKAIAALYDQPKAFLLDRVEVNITDNYKKWAIVKAQGWVYEMPDLAAAAPVVSPESAALAASIGDPGATPECDGVTPAPASAADAEAKRTALAARRDVTKRLDALAALEARVASRAALLDDLVRRRDDNRAAFSSHSDELVRRAQSAVTLLAELRFKANGEPDWR